MTDETDRRGIAAIGWGKQTTLGTPVTGDLSWWERFMVAPAFRDGKLIELSLVSDDKTVEDGDTGMTETMSVGQWDHIKSHAATLERLIEEGLDVGWLGEEYIQLVEEVNVLSDLNSLLRGKLEGRPDEQ